MISCFCCKVDESGALLGYYTMSSGISLLIGCPKEITTTRCVIA